jgi:hypothetical protein
MNEKLANVLIHLEDVNKRRNFYRNPAEFFDTSVLSDVDGLALASRNRAILKYQARFGDLTEERVRDLDFQSPDMELEHEHIEIGPEHEEGHEEGESFETNRVGRGFGPYARSLEGDVISDLEHVTPTKDNSLVIVGIGIGVAQLTREAVNYITAADVLLYCVADAATELEFRRLNPNYDDLYRFYGDGKPRRET